MNTKTILVLLIALVGMISVTAAVPPTEHYEGEYEYDGPNDNLEMTADWNYDVTEKRRVTVIEGEANGHVEYTYENEEDHREFIGANGHIDGKVKVNNYNGRIKYANVNVNGNVYTGYENVEHFEAVSYYDDNTGHRVTISAYDVVERYEQGNEFEGYLKIRNYRVRPASYFTWTPYEQHTWEEMNKVVTSKFRNRNSLETGIMLHMNTPDGTFIEAHQRTSTANGGAGNVMIVEVPAYTKGNAPWNANNVGRMHNGLTYR